MTNQPPLNGANFSVQRAPDGKFLPGSGGRPIGARNKTSKAAVKVVTDMFTEAVAVLRQRLAENDLAAAKIVLDVVLPKGQRVIEFGEDISPATIEAALSEGAITPAEAQTAASALEKLQNVRDVADLVMRVEELEAALAGQRR